MIDEEKLYGCGGRPYLSSFDNTGDSGGDWTRFDPSRIPDEANSSFATRVIW
jgi:hypothetical protein